MKIPNFLIIGAARSGSTTLTRFLARHPQVYLPSCEREPKFFSREEEYARGEEYYLQTYFGEAEKFDAVGEKSTEYMESRSVAERIYRFNPDMKLICIMRNPVDRVISNYWWSVHNGVEDRPIDEAVLAEWKQCQSSSEPITRLTATRPRAYIDRSFYYDNLVPFYDCFQRTNIHCILFEEFLLQEQLICDRLCTFLQIAPFRSPDIKMNVHRAVKKGDSLDRKIYKDLKVFLHEQNNKLPDLIGVDVWKVWDPDD